MTLEETEKQTLKDLLESRGSGKAFERIKQQIQHMYGENNKAAVATFLIR